MNTKTTKTIAVCSNCQKKQTDPDRLPCLCGEGFLMPVDAIASADPIPADPTSPEYFAWSVRREMREGDPAAAAAFIDRLRHDADMASRRARAASNAFDDALRSAGRMNLTNPETFRSLTPSDREDVASRIADLIDIARALRWIAQIMSTGATDAAPLAACDLPDGAGPDWRELVAIAERAIAGAGATDQQPFRVELNHGPNPDVRGGYWQDGNPDAPVGWIGADSIKHASRICRDYIRDHGLGGGNWTGGAIVNAKTGDPIGRVAYNGRVFGVDGSEIAFNRKG